MKTKDSLTFDRLKSFCVPEKSLKEWNGMINTVHITHFTAARKAKEFLILVTVQ
jgi:hypothetical protein